MLDIARIRRNEDRLIKSLREYYRRNFQNGESDETFLLWLEVRLAVIYDGVEDLEEEQARLKWLMGRVAWYYDRDINDWRPAVIAGLGSKDGYPVADVILDGLPRWGYGWQFIAGEVKPPAPDLSKTYP